MYLCIRHGNLFDRIAFGYHLVIEMKNETKKLIFKVLHDTTWGMIPIVSAGFISIVIGIYWNDVFVMLVGFLFLFVSALLFAECYIIAKGKHMH